MAANATAVWRVRPSGNNNNGGGFDTGIASFGTDYSQQNAAQVTQSGGTRTTSTVTLTDTGASFTSALIGNGIRVAGTGITTTYTFVTAVPTGTTLTLQTSPGTAGTSVTYSIGGGWADFWTNTTSALNYLVPGNRVRILGAGTPNPASYVADYTFAGAGTPVTLVSGDSTNGDIVFENDPLTPGYKAPPDTTGGMPVVSIDGKFILNGTNQTFQGLYFIASAATPASGRVFDSTTPSTIFGNVLDVLSFSNVFCGIQDLSFVAGNEVFSSVGNGGAASNAAIIAQGNNVILNNNIHDITTVFAALWVTGNGNNTIQGNIIAKCAGGDGILVEDNNNKIIGNTIDGNGGNGINVDTQAQLSKLAVLNNIISNHVAGGKAGVNIAAGTAAQNSRVALFVDYNTFYNNTTNYSGINAGPHDTALVTTPYNASATEDYKLI